MSDDLQERAREILLRDGRGEAIEYERRWYSRGEIRQVAEQLSAAIKSSGADPRAPVAFVARNRPSSLAAMLGLIAEGRAISMIYAFQSAAAIARDVKLVRPTAIVLGAEVQSAELLETLPEEGVAAIALSDMQVQLVPGLDQARPFKSSGKSSEPYIDVLTSGTTGPPKRFSVPYDTIFRFMLKKDPIAPGEAAGEPPRFLTMPLGNIAGLTATLSPLLNGARCVLLDRFSVAGWHDYVLRYRPSESGLPPAGFQMVLDANIPKEDLASIRWMSTGAAPLDPTVHRAFEERYDIPILLSYGATEFAGPVAAMTQALHAEWGEEKFGSVGRPMPGARHRIMDPVTFKELAPGREGILEVISPRIGPNWIRTSDLAVIDEDGFLFLRGRADGAIIRGGFKLLPEVIERALLRHPHIAEAAAAGVDDRRLGQVPGVCIEIKSGVAEPSVDELETHLRQHVPATHIPVHWLFVDELPKTPSFKIDRGAVRRMLGAHAESATASGPQSKHVEPQAAGD